jgi:hypothetical protein
MNSDLQSEYPDKWLLEKECKAYPEESQRAIGDDKFTEH